MPPRGVIVRKEKPVFVAGKPYYTSFEVAGVEVNLGEAVEVPLNTELKVRMWCRNEGSETGYFVLKLLDHNSGEVLVEKGFIAPPDGTGFWHTYRENLSRNRSLEVVLETYTYTGDPLSPKGAYICTDRYGCV